MSPWPRDRRKGTPGHSFSAAAAPWPLAALVVLCLAGYTCSRIVNQWSNRWSNPEYAAAHFKKVLVIGVSTQASIRRRFEDEFVATLEAAGVDAEPSYRYMPEDGQVDEARITEAIKQA